VKTTEKSTAATDGVDLVRVTIDEPPSTGPWRIRHCGINGATSLMILSADGMEHVATVDPKNAPVIADSLGMLELWRKHEWSGRTDYGSLSCCPECEAPGSNERPGEHHAGCRLGELLDRHKGTA